MLIAILMTNTDESDFAQRHPKDGEKFGSLLREVRPDWSFETFAVKDDVFPDGIERFDGFLVTGSPASVHDGGAWIGRLEQLIRDLASAGTPIFGACFGHQVIATALGGTVESNAGGWVLGAVDAELLDGTESRTVRLHAAHKEQVTRLPEGATITALGLDCPIAGFAIGNTVATTQYHPEMTTEFFAALVDEMAASTDPDVIERARASIDPPLRREAFAEIMAQFFERAQAAASETRAAASHGPTDAA